jgi:cytochrome c peroxidase
LKQVADMQFLRFRTSTFALGLSAIAVAAAPASARPANLPDPAGPEDFPAVDAQEVALGRQLFFDPILSGNQNIACATCHHPAFGTSDGMSLSIGEGGYGLGPERDLAGGEHIYARIPRNAPSLWNRGALEFSVMFHDGRLSMDPAAVHGVRMPPGSDLERALGSALAAQATLPITSPDEMAGQKGENPIADAMAEERLHGEDGAWAQIAARVEGIPEYRTAFDWVIGAGEPIHITDVASALAAFMRFEFRSTDSPFDRYLRGDDTALTDAQKRGMELFYGDAGCVSCHSGTFQTDHDYHALGIPQFGPGKEPPHAPYADIGHGAVSGDPLDDYKFRTPSLRNVTLTAPYGHTGAYGTLEAMIRHHLDPEASLRAYDRTTARLHGVETDHDDFEALDDPAEIDRIAAAIEIDLPPRTDDEIADLIAFLEALEDPVAKAGRLGIPEAVPSGLPLDPVPDADGPQLAEAEENVAETPAAAPRPVAAVAEAGPVVATPASLDPSHDYGVAALQIRRIARGSVGLRAGPGAGHGVVATLPFRTNVEVLSQPQNGWVRLRSLTGAGEVGWCRLSDLTAPRF